MTKVPINEIVSDLWADLSASQKFVSLALVALIVVAIAGSWWNTFQTWSEVRVHEREAAKARQERDVALEKAAKIANVIKIREEELAKVEVKRDAKSEEVKRAAEDVKRDRAEYERSVRERRPDAPSTDELCRELGALGYPCYPR